MSFTKTTCGCVVLGTVLTIAGCAAPEPGDEGEETQEATACSVPSFVSGTPGPVGFASLNGGTTGGGSATPQVVTTLAQFNSAAGGTGVGAERRRAPAAHPVRQEPPV